MTTKRRTVADSVAGRVRKAVTRKGAGYFWRPTDFPGLDTRVVDRALVRMKDAGELVSVRRGLYWRGTSRPWGMSRPDMSAVVATVTGARGFGPAGVSAANDLGLSTQVPGTDLVAIAGPLPRPLPTVKFVARPSRIARRSVRLSPAEVAVLEVLDDWDAIMEATPRQAVTRLADLIRSGAVKADKLVAGSRDEPPAGRERLKVVLAHAGRDDLAAKVASASGATTRSRALLGLGV